MTAIENSAEASVEQRRYLRSVFTYPVEFRLLSQRIESNHVLQNLLVFVPPFTGYLKDISLGGAAIQAEDRQGRFNVEEAESARVLLTLSIPRENKVNVPARIRWVKKEEDNIRIGISFKGLEHKDLTLIEKLIGLRGKDRTMLWNLWEKYCSSVKPWNSHRPLKTWWRKVFSDN